MADEQTPAKKAAAKKSPAKKTPAKKVAAKKAPAKKAAVKKVPAKKAPAKKAPAKKVAAKGTPAKAAAEKVPAKKAPAKKAPAKKAPAKKAPAKKAPAKKAPAKKVAAEAAPAKKVPAKEASATGSSMKVSAADAAASNAERTRDDVPDLGLGPLGAHPSLTSAAEALAGVADSIFGDGARDRIDEALDFLRRRATGDYDVDMFGFDPEFTETFLLPLLRPLYKSWFRVECRGVENIPADGGALVVANHSGTVPLDSLMTQVAVHDEHPQRRHLRMLGADLIFSLPVVSDLARKSGTTLACNEDALGLLRAGELVGVWPEGFKGVGKPFSERYKLQRFGRGGFVTAAVRAGVPIVPCTIVGAEEIYPMLANVKPLAKLLGLPYVPVTPTFPWLGPLGLVPLPSKWIIEFSPPIPADEMNPAAADDPMVVFDLTDRVRDTIARRLEVLVDERGAPFG